MFRFLRTTLFQQAIANLKAPPTTAAFLPFTRPNCAAAAAVPSLTLHFLQTSCGLSPDAAAAAAEKVHLKTTDNADAVLALLRDYGFTKLNIAAFVSRRPDLLLASPDGTLKPKLDFFRAEVGLSDANLPKLLSSSPRLLSFSVENRLGPNLAFLRSIAREYETQLYASSANWARMLTEDLSSILPPRVDALRSYGATDTVILTLVTDYPKAMTHACFWDAFETIKRLPIRPSASTFARALGLFVVSSKRTWDSKLGHFRRLGWSEEQVFRAFSRHPNCMLASTEKIRKNMEFLAKKLGWGLDYIAVHPVMLSLSLEKRIRPRCLILAFLASKGLFGGKVRAKQLRIGKEEFLKTYVIKYQDELLELFKAAKDGIMELEDSEMKCLDHTFKLDGIAESDHFTIERMESVMNLDGSNFLMKLGNFESLAR